MSVMTSVEGFLVTMILAGIAIMAAGFMWQSFQARRNMFRS